MEVIVGQRITCDDCLATVKFIGEVPPTQGTWLGVEWDDACRGKHDGSYEGKRYFQTSHPTSGSFVRPKKCSTGVAFMDAVREKYGKVQSADTGDLYVVGGKNQHTAVVMVGMEQINQLQSQFNRLTSISLYRMGVVTPGHEGEISSSLPRVTELDISENLLTRWSDVEKIIDQLPFLAWLNISGNHLEISECSKSYGSVKVLCANNLRYDWSEITRCTAMFVGLTELYVCFNRISQIDVVPRTFEQLSLLNLEGNPLRDWNNVVIFGKLENLKTLKVNNAELDRVFFPDCSTSEETGISRN